MSGKGRARWRFPSALARLLATLVAYVVAVYGFDRAYGANGGAGVPLADSAFKALQLVVGVFPQDLAGRPLPWSLQLARWALPLLTLWTAWEAAWAQLRNPVRLRWIRRRGGHLVVAGEEALALPAIMAERRVGGPILLWTDEVTAPWVGRLADLQVPHAPKTGADSGAAELGLERARAVLLLGKDEANNIALALGAADAAAARPSGDPLPVLVRAEDADLRDTIERRFIHTADRRTARLRLISIADLLARQLFTDRPLDGFLRVGAAARTLLILGFTPVAERYILRVLAGGHFRDGVRPRIVVIDPAAERAERVFRSRWPQADPLSSVIFEAAEIAEPALLGETLGAAIERHGAPVALLIDAPGDGRALALGEAANTAFDRLNLITPPIHVRMSRPPVGPASAMIRPFGELETLADPERLLQERHDALARSIHDCYFQGQLDEGRVVGSHGSMLEWEDLSERVRDDNRLVADCYQLKLRDVDARLRPGSESRLRFEDEEVEELARAEHDRWMAAKRVDGWTHGTTRDDGLRRHPDLVPYDDLPEAVKDLDREQVRLISRLLPRSHHVAVRTLVIAVAPLRDTGEEIARQLPETLAAMAETHPDRLPLLRGSLEDVAARTVLAAAREAGAEIQLLLHRNADAEIDRLPAAEAMRARELVRTADTLFACPADDSGVPHADFLLTETGLVRAGEDATSDYVASAAMPTR